MKAETPIEEFGRTLIVTGDLDPLYIAMVGAQLEPVRLKRLLFAYWCFYNAGAASFMADAPDANQYWGRMLKAAYNTVEAPVGGRWPRGHERRHFRGQASVVAVDRYMQMAPNGGEYLVDQFAFRAEPDSPLPFRTVAKRVQMLPQFGPWMSFKVGDMLERVLGIPVCFDNADVFMFDSPMKAARMIAHRHGQQGDGAIEWVVNHLKSQYTDLAAPPHFDRPVQLQEVETVLCKWKSSLTGHYPMGLDSEELLEGLHLWCPYSATAGRLLNAFQGFRSGDLSRHALDLADGREATL